MTSLQFTWANIIIHWNDTSETHCVTDTSDTTKLASDLVDTNLLVVQCDDLRFVPESLE